MLVVSDATPLNILIRAELVEVLPQLYTKIVIPPAVADELRHERTPKLIHDWLLAAPHWLEIRAPAAVVAPEHKGLGERQAIALALEIHADFFLSDDRGARRVGKAAGLNIIGTIGVLRVAAEQGLIALAPSIERVRAAGLFLTARMIDDTLRRYERENP